MTVLSDAVKANNGNAEEIAAAEWLSNGSRETMASEAVEAYYFIGQWLHKLSENHTQREAKAIRDQYLVGEGKALTANEATGCRKIYENHTSKTEAVKAYAETGKTSINAARIWATLRGPSESKKADPLKALTSAINKAVNEADLMAVEALLKAKLKEIQEGRKELKAA